MTATHTNLTSGRVASVLPAADDAIVVDCGTICWLDYDGSVVAGVREDVSFALDIAHEEEWDVAVDYLPANLPA